MSTIIERDIYCPYCEMNSAVLISESVKDYKLIGCAPLGCTNTILMVVTCGCWAYVNGYPVLDIKDEHTVQLYGFCPHCGNTYPVIKPDSGNQR